METRPDVLGEGYDAVTLPLADDDEGEVVATLVRRLCGSRRAVLYTHGFADYFFQTQLADYYLGQGFDFYALDLRKYGRSLLPHQTPNYCRSLREYFEDLDAAVRVIREDHDTLLVNGHSTGGLITALWCDERPGVADALFLNSPFLEFPVPPAARVAARPAVAALARSRPHAVWPAGVSTYYVQSIHRGDRGEWDFDLRWKPLAGFPVRAGWLDAVQRVQRTAQAGLSIDCPVLAMCSTASTPAKRWDDAIMHTDAVLNVDDIVRHVAGLGPVLTFVRVDGGIHDLVLSAAPVRAQVYAELTRWLGAYM